MHKHSLINLFFLLSLLLNSTTVLGTDNSCPLENVKYKPLRESVEVLLKNVQLEPGCEAYEETLKTASSDLSQVIKSDEETTSVTNKNPDQLATEANQALDKTTTAINSISSINHVLRGRCGKKLMTSFDYMEALTDTVVGLGPLLLLSEGNTALVLYTTVAGQIIKGLINFFRGKKIDMSKAEVRNQFIKNSCAFYSLNNKIRSLLYTLDTQLSTLDDQLREAQQQLLKLQNSKPERPASPLFQTEQKLRQQRQELERLKKMITRIHAKSFSCQVVQRSIQKGYGEEVATTLEGLLDQSEDGQDIRVFLKIFRSDINKSEEYTGNKCSERVPNWLAAIKDLQELTQEQLQIQLKKQVNHPRFAIYNNWQKQITNLQNQITKLQGQKKSLIALKASGHNIDLSEILDNRDTIKRALFENSSWRTKSAAHSWLEYKVEQSFGSLELFKDRLDDLETDLHDLKNISLSAKQQQDLCTSLELIKDSWVTANSHLQAAETYCHVFTNVIEKHEFKKTYNYCFRYKSLRCTARNNDPTNIWETTEDDECNTTKHNINSVRAEKLELKQFFPKAKKIQKLLQQYHCPRPIFKDL